MLFKWMINKLGYVILKVVKLRNLVFIDVIGVLMIHKVNHLLIICLFLMILVNKYWDIFIKDIIPLFLHMGKQVLGNLILFKGIKRKVYFSFVLKIYLKGKKSKMMLKVFQHKSK